MLKKVLYPNFEIDSSVGQLCLDERLLLYGVVRRSKPRHCFEIGSWRGCGSTYIIASALSDNKKGILITSEIDVDSVMFSINTYKEFPELESRVIFEAGKSVDVFPYYLSRMNEVDFIFMDGSNNPCEQFDTYKLIENYLYIDSIIGLHDWPGDKTLGMAFLEKDGNWEMVAKTTEIIFFQKVS